MREDGLVLPWGIFGAGNIGDEAMLQGFAELVSGLPDVRRRIWVACRDPSHVAEVVPDFKYFRLAARRSPLQWWALRSSRGYLIVGDTPVMDYLGSWPLAEIAEIVALARERRKRIACLGIGTETLLHDQSIARISEEIAPVVQHWTVRTDADRTRLVSYGVDEHKVTVAADLAWLVSPVDASFGARWLREFGFGGHRPLIGVNVSHDHWSREQAPGLLSSFAEVLDDIIAEHDVDVMLFPNEIRGTEEYDLWALRGILSRAKRRDRMFAIPGRYWHPRQAMSFVACCSVTLTTRYHFALFSAIQGVPFVGLSRLGKLAELCADLGWPHQRAVRGTRTDNLRPMLDECIRSRTLLSEALDRAARTQVVRAKRNLASLEVVLEER